MMTNRSPLSSNQPSSNQQAELARVLAWRENPTQHPTTEGLQSYAEAQLRGASYQTDYPELARHLDACVACAEAYAHLYELLLAEQGESLTVPEEIPGADLAFLQPVAPRTLATQIRNAIEVVGQRLTFQLRPDFLPGLQPAFGGAAFRAPSDEERYQEQILDLSDEAFNIAFNAEAEAEAEFPLAIVAYRDAQLPDNALLEITISPPDRGWPDLADIEVTIHLAAESRSAITDAWGLAVFTDVPIVQLAEMRIEAAL